LTITRSPRLAAEAITCIVGRRRRSWACITKLAIATSRITPICSRSCGSGSGSQTATSNATSTRIQRATTITVWPRASSVGRTLRIMGRVPLLFEATLQLGELLFDRLSRRELVQFPIERVFARRLQEHTRLGERVDGAGARRETLDFLLGALHGQTELS